MFSGDSTATDIPERTLTNEYLSENIYQFLAAVDDANAMIQDPTLIQTAADLAKRSKNGDLSRGIGFVHKMPVISSITREVPVLQLSFACTNESASDMRIWLDYTRDKQDTWTT